MSILPDWRIRELAQEGMIEPFEERLVRNAQNAGVISYGLSSFGYDLRCAPEWKVFVNAFNTVVDPKDFDPKGFIDVVSEEIIIPPNSFVLARSVEYLKIPDTVMVVALGKSTYARCFSENTRVALADGTSPTLKEMAERSAQGEAFFGYSLNEHGRIIVTLLESPRLIGQDRLLEIELDNGEVIEATPDHEFITRDGRSVQAGSLKAGDSLMPLYRKAYRGYEMVYQPLSGHMYPTHRLADEWNLQNGIYEDAPGTHRHHQDHNRRNNNPWNITRVDASEHIRMHNAITYLSQEQGGAFDPAEHSLSIKDALAELRQNDTWYRKYRAAQSVKASNFWQDERYAEARGKLLLKHLTRWTAAEREKQQERLRAAYQNPELREKIGQLSRAAWSKASDARISRQQEIARNIRLRPEINEETVRQALDETGSIRGAARMLNCDRSVFRRFRHVVQAFKGTEVVNHKVVSIREKEGQHDVYCLTVPEAGNFALEAGVFVHNCGIVANVTPLEPGWEGHVTLEFSNTTPLPAKMYANEGCVQLLFFEGERPEVTYRDRGGKYQGQTGVTLPKL
ncbi:dCTP deaminase domain-containing protein [Deinococcus roseus]|uniref:dCTP deaminase n=1 Tax=Deinococcus roseus TaxID=392414 RepID=A0ABQ2D0D5_9DEIO|nr:hypothetical protein GCM10008938_24080 [Deinococcus roseus]